MASIGPVKSFVKTFRNYFQYNLKFVRGFMVKICRAKSHQAIIAGTSAMMIIMFAMSVMSFCLLSMAGRSYPPLYRVSD